MQCSYLKYIVVILYYIAYRSVCNNIYCDNALLSCNTLHYPEHDIKLFILLIYNNLYYN